MKIILGAKNAQKKNFAAKTCHKNSWSQNFYKKIPGMENPTGKKILETRKKIPATKKCHKKIPRAEILTKKFQE